jgi:hypothetical protein
MFNRYSLPVFLGAFVVSASPITITVPDGAKIQIQATYNGGGAAFTAAGLDGGALDENPAPGKFTFTPPNQSQIRTIEVKSLGAIFPGVAAVGWYDFGPAGLDAWVPFALPLIGSPTTGAVWATLVDVAAYGTQTPYTTGDPVDVNNGTVTGPPGLSVRDASGTYQFSSFFDVFFTIDVGTLPTVTGRGLTLDPVQAGIPEPATGGLLLAGLVMAMVWRRR